MALTFIEADKLFREDNLNEITRDPSGKRYLKLRSLSRTTNLEKIFSFAKIEKPDVGSRELFKAAFEANISIATIEAFIRNVYQEEQALRAANEKTLLNQMYKVQEFNWGGLHQNSLEKTIVDNYVKRITDYDMLCKCVENELLVSMRGYVICSWFNHWTSIIIEDIFKSHKNVLPAVGLVKKIDFFIKDVPFDLKVTYLPEEFVVGKRREAKLRPELTLLKQQAREHGLPLNDDLGNSALMQDLWLKVSDHPATSCKELIAELLKFRNNLVARIENDPIELIRWLYENQGERRFDASNRLFLVLVDQRNYFESWKLKRAKALMQARIDKYLDKPEAAPGVAPGRKIDFTWEGTVYNTVSDVIVVRQPPSEV